MKKLGLFFISFLVLGLLVHSQPTLVKMVDFEAGIPANWTTNNATNAQVITTLASSGQKSLRIKNSTTPVEFVSETFTRTPGSNMRLEFSHIPMLRNQEGAGQVQISFQNASGVWGNWIALGVTGGQNPTGYDATYGGGVLGGTSWSGSFVKVNYWGGNTNIPENNLDSSYWRHEVFYLNNAFASTGASNTFRIRFTVLGTTPANTFSGWYLDDIRLYQSVSTNTVRLPQFKGFVESPNMINLPNCTDVKVEARIDFAQSQVPASTDSIYIEYMIGSDNNRYRTRMTHTSSNLYETFIPFNGFDTVIKWRMVINDLYSNRLTYPFVLGSWNTFKNVRPYEGEIAMATTGLSSQELLIKTNAVRSLYQFRYRASELRALGITAGKIKGFLYNVITATSGAFVMQGFNVSMTNLPPSFVLPPSNPYNGSLTNVFGPTSMSAPQVGWREILFNQNFLWDGESDLLIKVCWDNGINANPAGATKIESYPAPTNPPSAATGQFYQVSGWGDACGASAMFNPADPLINFRPNLKFKFAKECVLKIDAGVGEMVSPQYCQMPANTPTNIVVKLRNYGSDTLHNMKVYYKIDGGNTVYGGTWSGTLLPDMSPNHDNPTTVNFTINNIQFDTGYRKLEIWTDSVFVMRNGQTIYLDDWEPNNNSVSYQFPVCGGHMKGVYAIGNVSGVAQRRKFNNFYEAFEMLKCCGVSAPVIFKVENLPQGTFYADTLLTFPQNIQGTSNTNYIKFISADPNSYVEIKAPVVINYSVDMSGCSYMKFEKFKFYTANNSLASGTPIIIKASKLTSNIEFNKCVFTKDVPTSTNYESLIDLGGANYISFDSCTFNGYTTSAQLNILGTGAEYSTGIQIKNTSFLNNLSNAISANYTKNLKIERNIFKNNRTTPAQTIYNIIVPMAVDSLQITKNLFVLSNVSAIYLGSLSDNVIIANNKISVFNNNPNNLTTTLYGIYAIGRNNIQILYNNLYLKDKGIAGNFANGIGLGTGAAVLNNFKIKNNIILSDGYGYSVYARPTTNSTLDFSNNMYYKLGTMVTTPSNVLWKYNSTNCTTLADWRLQLNNGDSNTYVEDPIFAAWDNLNTTNTFLCYKGLHLTNILDDFNGNTRPLTGGTCIGAVQFNPPPSNIFVEQAWIDKGEILTASDGKTMYSACGLGNDSIRVKFSNISNNQIIANSLKLCYKIDNLPIPNSQKDTISFLIDPYSTYTYTFKNPYNFTATSTDKDFKVKVFSVLTEDLVHNNDTAVFHVRSRYQLSAPAPMNITIPYGDSVLLSVNSNDSIYWYINANDESPILKSHSYQTSRLYNDTIFYFSRKEEIPKLKISEIQFSKSTTALGITPNMPAWVTTNNIFEISNYGNGAINLEGYKLAYVVGNNTALSNTMSKILILPNYVLYPNKTVVLQIVAGVSQDSSVCINLGTGSTFSTSSKAGFLIKDANDNIIDAVTMNGSIFNSATNVPTTIYSGAGKMIPMGTAGLIRTNRDANDSTGWTPSSNTNIMSIGVLDSTQIWKRDNACYGYKSQYSVHVDNVPTIDPGVLSLKLQGIDNNEACTLNDENVEIKLINTGISSCTNVPLVLNLIEGNTILTTLNDTCRAVIAAGDTVSFTFSSPINLTANTTDRTFRILCYTNHSADVIHINDSADVIIVSLKTPLAPLSNNVFIPYAQPATLTATANGNPNDVLIWYNSPISHNELSRGGVYTTPNLFVDDTLYVGAMLLQYDTLHLGNSTTISNGYPSPLNPNTKNVKEQYLIKASELKALGLKTGNINGIMFNISSISTTAILSNYSIKIGTTNNDVISSWETNLTEVYNKDKDTLLTTSIGWKSFHFTQPVYYDGESNLVIEVCFSKLGTTNPLIKTFYTPTGFNSVINYRHNSIDACAWTGLPMPINQTFRPNIAFDVDIFGCPSVRTPVIVNVDDPDSCDAGITHILSPSTQTVNSGISIPIEIKLKNYGSKPFTSANIHWTINGIVQPVFAWTGTLTPNQTTNINIGSYIFLSGNNNITAWVELTSCNDTIRVNDTCSFDFSACMGNSSSVTHFTIGGTTANYPNITAAITALTNSGICGNVVFDISPVPNGYEEQINIPFITGTDLGRTITFKGNAPDSNAVVLKYNPGTNPETHTLSIDGSSNLIFENLRIESSSVSSSKVIEIKNYSSEIKFERVVIKVQSATTPTSEITKLVNINGANNNIIFNKVHFCGGAIGINADLPTDTVSKDIVITNSFFNSFAFNGIRVEGIKNLKINSNKFREYANNNISSAIFLRNIKGVTELLANDIYLTSSGALNVGAVRTGIDIRRVYSDEINPAIIANNAISIMGPYSNSNLASIGINIDSTDNANIYYNTVNLRASNNSNNSKSLNIAKECSNIRVVNNNLDNSGKGFAYYVFAPTTQVILSNNNNYNTTGNILAYWNGNKNNLTLLRTANSQDALSVSEINPFLSDSVLNILYPSEIVRKAEPLDDIPVDIIGTSRLTSIKPTIGAYEYIFKSIDIGVTALNDPVKTTKYIENGPIYINSTVKNFGLYSIDTIFITAHLKYKADTTHIIQTVKDTIIHTINSLESHTFSMSRAIYPPLHFRSLQDSLHLCVYTTKNQDNNNINDTAFVNFLVIPAYNLQSIRTESITERCQLYNVPIIMTFKNVGEKTVKPTDSIWLCYEVDKRPDLFVRELFPVHYLGDPNYPSGVDSIQKNEQITYTFQTQANFYPLGLTDTIWKLRTYTELRKDNVKINDTSLYINVNSRVSPPAPITHDTTIHYGTWAEPWATQINSYPIKWFKDSNDVSPFYSPTIYTSSVKYNTTQLFTDSIFYVRVNLNGSYPCKSYFTPIKVNLLPRSPIDGACIGLQGEGIVAPPKTGWVYMTDDTVRVKVSNFGTSAIQNSNITYSIQMTSPADSPITTITETCTNPIPADGSLIYTFDHLANFSDPLKTYKLRAWIKTANDIVAINDTSDYWLVKPKNGNTIYPPSVATNANSLDITRVQIANMDNSSDNTGNKYTDFTNSIPPAVLFKGIYDSLYVYCKKPSIMEDTARKGGWVRAYIDWDRNGVFDPIAELVLSDTIWNDSFVKARITIPANALIGHSRMRIILWQDKTPPFDPNENPSKGEVEDYKVFVRDTWNVNAELMKFVSPKESLESPNQNISIVLRNTGKTNLTNAIIHWKRNDEEHTYDWAGNLAPAEREIVVLQANATIPAGKNHFTAWVDVTGDDYHINDTIRRTSYLYKMVNLTYKNDFDDGGFDDFNAPHANPLLPNNCWEFGTPDVTNTKINAPYSVPNCWKTKLSGKYPKNNESILYSPIYNTGLIKPDTLIFMMRRELAAGSSVHVEYRNYNTDWKKLGVKNDEFGTNWYNNDDNTFTGSKPWQRIVYSTQNLTDSGNVGTTFQLRFVFRSENADDDGVAIDNFELKRGLRSQDAGIINVSLTPTQTPNYGSNYYPKVVIKNYGSAPLTNFYACYIAEDMHIPRCEQIIGVNIPPSQTMEYTFTGGRYVDVSLPNPFNICAFTRLNPTDLYADNDSICEQFIIEPLMKDAALLAITSPGSQIVANNMIPVEIHIKNMGMNSITTLPVGYKVSGQNEVLETITFNPPLNSNEEFIYRFNTEFRSAYGSTNIKSWVGLEGDYYHRNDTLYLRTNGATTTRDLEAKYITIDDYHSNYIGVQLTFINNSSIAVNNISVGYYINGDIATAQEEVYRLGNPLPANKLAHHYFNATLTRTNAPYSSICGYVKLLDDNNTANDTTCRTMMGVRDIKVDTIYIEHTSNDTALVQMTARNIGTIGGPGIINTGFVLNGESPVLQSYNLLHNEPNENLYFTFNKKILRNDSKIYDIKGWVDWQYDANRSNDTTKTYIVVSLIGLDDDIENKNLFTLNQNIPNPFEKTTKIDFYIPRAGNTRFFVVNNMGQVIVNESKYYLEGKHEIMLKDLNLPQGIYYYTMEFDGKRLMKKMIIAR